MTREKFTLALLLLFVSPAYGKHPGVEGTWSGTFHSKHGHIAPYELAIKINPNLKARIINKSGITSCLARGDIDLQVIVNGSDVVVSGSDEAGNTITFHGTLDSAGKVLTSNYVTNGSASGKCETDDGTAHLQKK